MLRRSLYSLTLLLLLNSPAFAQKTISLNTGNSQISILVWIGCEGTNCAGKTVDATAGGVTLTGAQFNPTCTDQPAAFCQAQVAICYNTGAKIWTTSSSTITLATARGLGISDGSNFTIYGFTSINNFHAIRDAAVSSTLYCDYYRQP